MKNRHHFYSLAGLRLQCGLSHTKASCLSEAVKALSCQHGHQNENGLVTQLQCAIWCKWGLRNTLELASPNIWRDTGWIKKLLDSWNKRTFQNCLQKTVYQTCYVTFPGSLWGRGTFRKHLFRDRLCRIEFCKLKYQNTNVTVGIKACRLTYMVTSDHLLWIDRLFIP